jgi:spore coat protein CotH
VRFFSSAKRGLAAVVAAAFVLTGFQALPAQAATGPSKYVEGSDPAAFLYDPLNINTMELTLPEESLRELAGDTYALRTGTVQVGWQPGTAVFTSYKGKLPAMSIGTHLKGGWGSRRPIARCDFNGCSVVQDQKPGIKIKFDFGDAYDAQRFYGLKEITLNSMVQDPSMLREMTAYRIARSAGIPTPRAGYMKLIVNGVDLGLHMILETYDKQLYKRWFTSGTQHSYEGAYWQDLITQSTGRVDDYTMLQAKSGDETNKDDIARIAEINSLNGSDWWDAINGFADMGELTSNWAFERFIEHWDAYSWFIINNYQVRFDDSGIMTMHPWGIDQTLTNMTGEQNVTYFDTATTGGQAVGIMFTKCMGSVDCRALYQSSLARLGEVANAINSPGFVEEVWAAISPTVFTESRFYPGRNFTGNKDVVKNFVATRTSTSEFRNAVTLRKVAELGLTYSPPTNFVAGTVLSPLVMNNTNTAPTFRLMGDPANAVCSLDPYTGEITAIAPGDCVVSISTPAGENLTNSYHAGYAIAFVDLGKMPGTVVFPKLTSIASGRTVPFAVTSNSTGAITYTTNSSCKYVAGKLTATAATGTCIVTVKVGKDPSHYSATATLRLAIARETVKSYALSTEAGYTATAKLPKGQTLKLINKASKVVGPCSVSGATLKALASTGRCTVTIAGWVTTSRTYLAKSFFVNLAPNPQTWVQKVAAPANRKKIGTSRFTIASAETVTTTAGQEGFFSFVGNCIVETTPKSTYVQMTGSGTCTVTLEADAGFKVRAIRTVWKFVK